MFFVASFAGAYIRCSLLIGTCHLLGHEWMLSSHYLKTYFPYLVAVRLGVIALYILYTYHASLPKLARIFIRLQE